MGVTSPVHFNPYDLYFKETEFWKCVPACTFEQMNPDFMHRLMRVRKSAGIPFKLNCAYRPRDYDISKGRSGNSFHCSGRAVDIECKFSNERALIINAAIKHGMYGIGIADNFVHLDDRSTPMIWLYK